MKVNGSVRSIIPMGNWDKVLPSKVYRLIYEDLVVNQEEETAKLLDYCGLEFEEKCLKFYESERAVKTASSEQVRQPMYTQSLEVWKNYDDINYTNI